MRTMTCILALALAPAALAQDGDNPWSGIGAEGEAEGEDDAGETKGASATRPAPEEETVEAEAETVEEEAEAVEEEAEADEEEAEADEEEAEADEEEAAEGTDTPSMTEPNPFIGSAPLPELRYEVSLELGSLLNGDSAYDLFDDNNVMPSAGVRLGARVIDRVAIVAGWHRVRRGATVSVFSDETDADFESDVAPFRAAFFADEFTLGPKVDASIEDILFPYVLAQGMVLRGVMKLDDDPDVDTNPGQVTGGGLNAGLLGMAGFEVRLPRGQAPLTASWHLEMGYGWLGRASYDAFGDMKPGGFAVRSGLGVRF